MRILVADDQAAMRSAVRLLLEDEPNIEVIGEAGEVKALLITARAICPDLVLLDWELPGIDSTRAGRNLLRALHACCPRLCVLVLSGRPEASFSAREAGADYFVSKADPPDSLLRALREIAGSIA